ncbi:iron-siderophore ABC transporter substrate-binding protein [Thalassospira lucentensis]|uniref:ABC transporter substrate-binding protein n=1 Tax=Thalassospira lucentensis TaxID=168935 RepID=UPI002942E134|nr:iron-siderophore ABC transporter substrate-binding protein [Thalassospira lucentensis]WOI11198.1 iron-siderophore ABC transporter substrate-binding protein [Thalassospira lucentensis]
MTRYLFLCLSVIAGLTAPLAPKMAIAEPVTIEHERGTLTLDAPAKRVAVTNWATTETVIALGLDPVAIADPDDYLDWVAKPDLPENFTDIGQRAAPNIEALRDAKPDLIVISKDLEMAYDNFNAIAPTIVLSIYNNNLDALPEARKLFDTLAKATGREVEAAAWLADADDKFAEYGARIRAAMPPGRALAITQFVSESHIGLYGKSSLPGTVLAKMDLPLAYQGPVNNWGFAKGGVEILGPRAQDTLVYLNPVPDVIREKVWASPVWKILDFVRNDRVYELPVVWAYGGMPSALRFARLLAESMESGPVK